MMSALLDWLFSPNTGWPAEHVIAAKAVALAKHCNPNLKVKTSETECGYG